MHVRLAHILPKLSLAVFHLGPIDLLRTQSFANTERDHDPARARADHRDLWQLAGDRLLHTEKSAQPDRQDSRVIVITKSEWHLEIVRRMLSVRINEVAFAIGAGVLKYVHHRFRRGYQIYC